MLFKKEKGKEEPENMGRLEAPVLMQEDDAPALVEIDMADIEAGAIDNFNDDEGYDSMDKRTYYTPQEENEMIFASLSSNPSDASDSEYVPGEKVIINDIVHINRPRRQVR